MQARLVTTIVCAHRRDELPTSWLAVFHRFQRTVERAGLRVRVRLLPLEELPETFEVLVVSPELLERAEKLAGGARVIPVARDGAAAAVDALVREIEQGVSLQAERARPDDPKVVVHRGPEIL